MMATASVKAGAAPLRQALEYVRSRGIWATLRRVFTAFVFTREHYVLVYKPMDQDLPRVEARIPGVIRAARLEDLDALSVFAHHYTAAQFRHWIEQGRCLYVFEHAGRLIGYRLVNREVPRFGPARDVVRLEPTDTWVVNAYTLPEFRGARIGAALANHILTTNRDAGFTREISLIRIENEASRKMVGLNGAREMQEITFTRFLGYKRCQIRPAHARRYYEGGAAAGGGAGEERA